jgi:hypothetical protein
MFRFPPEPEDGQTRIEWEWNLLNPWRNEIKRRLLAERGWRCERCGSRQLPLDLDEAIVPRADMRGLSLDRRRLAFGEPNLSIACAECNRESAHDRDGAWERACARYGEEAMRDWYRSLNLKAPRKEWL